MSSPRPNGRTSPGEGRRSATCITLRSGVYILSQMFSLGGPAGVRLDPESSHREPRTEGTLGVTNQLAALLVAGDPRGAADRTLDFLLSLNKARGAAVFALDGDRLNLFTGRG